MAAFDFDLEIQRADDTWLSLNDGINYKVAADSFETSAIQYRRTEVTSPYVGGSFLVHAVPQNAMETVQVYCYGASFFAAQTNVTNLINAIAQLRYQVRKSVADTVYTYSCYTADYSVTGSNVYVASKMIPVTLQIPRLPQVSIEVAS